MANIIASIIQVGLDLTTAFKDIINQNFSSLAQKDVDNYNELKGFINENEVDIEEKLYNHKNSSSAHNASNVFNDSNEFGITLKDALNSSKNRLDNIVSSSGTSNQEIVDARYCNIQNKTFNILKDRLDDFGQQILDLGGYNLKWKGAKGDDTADDTAAFFDANTSAKGKVLFIPKGIYKVSGQNLRFTNGLKGIIAEPGAIIKYYLEDNATIEFDQMEDFFVYNLEAMTADLSENRWIRDVGAQAFFFDRCNNFYAEKLKVHQWNGMGIYLFGCDTGRVTRSRVKDTRADGIHCCDTPEINGILYGSKNITFDNNYCENTEDDAVASVGYAGRAYNENIKFLFNTSKNCLNGFRFAGTRGGEAAGNVVITPQRAGCNICCDVNEVSGYATMGVDDIWVHNSTIIKPQAWMGMFVWSNGEDADSKVSNVTLQDNTIINPQNSGIRVSTEKENVIALEKIDLIHNKIYNLNGTTPPDQHMIFAYRVKGITAKDNYVYRTATNYYGMYIVDTVTDAELIHNECDSCWTGLRVDAAHTKVSDNYCHNSVSHGAHINADKCEGQGNRFNKNGAHGMYITSNFCNFKGGELYNNAINGGTAGHGCSIVGGYNTLKDISIGNDVDVGNQTYGVLINSGNLNKLIDLTFSGNKGISFIALEYATNTIYKDLRVPVNTIPTVGYYNAGEFIVCSDNTERGSPGSKYRLQGWERLTSGTGHVLNTDWRELRALTGN